jgi:uracil-DNA glycosylase
MEEEIHGFIVDLTVRRSNGQSYNPYREPILRQNLLSYLGLLFSQPGRRILLVGEALGYRGGRLTGIPFSSERLLTQAPHPFLRSLSRHATVTGDSSEATATIVWNALAGRRRIPLFWNAFPFHPHHPGEPRSNRSPTASEVAEGQVYLRRLAALYQPRHVAGLGCNGYLAARSALPGIPITRIRHPSHGGKSDFERGLARLLRV